MHKSKANACLDQVKEQIKGAMWLLDRCTHNHGSHMYPHHVRDRITESLIAELTILIKNLEYVQEGISKGLIDEKEEEKDKAPF